MAGTPSVEPIGFPERHGTDTGVTGKVHGALRRAKDYLFSIQREDGHWCVELESNVTITSEYVFMMQMLGLDFGPAREKIIRYLEGGQNADGSWAIARHAPGDVSTTAETYLALRILGRTREAPSLLKAERYILKNGGLEAIRIFTRIHFAMFGLVPWESIPQIPPEVMLISNGAPVNIYSLSSWARGTMVPLFVIFHHKPVYGLPNGRSKENGYLDHLWLNPRDKRIPYSEPWIQILLRHGFGWKTLFGAADFAFWCYDRVRSRTQFEVLRKRAIRECVKWILERQEPSGDWSGIFPPMINGVIALTLEGYPLDSEPVKNGLKAIRNFSWEDASGFRIQPCVSPVWDTVLSMVALLDCGVQSGDAHLTAASRWILDKQILLDHGDWKVRRPGLRPGGWSFEYYNSWYPDVDDTAAVIIGLLKKDLRGAETAAVRRAVEWVVGMQNRDGGWGAFDVDNDKFFLNEIPFSDMESLCDPSSPDVTGRVIEAFGHWLAQSERGDLKVSHHMIKRVKHSVSQGLKYLRKNQEAEGSWFGRWGVNYVYGTSNVLCGLAAAGISAEDPIVARAIRWLRNVQNSDGGWGESIASYQFKGLMGCGESTASQTAWALMGLLSYVSARERIVTSGIRWLLKNQKPAAEGPALEAGQPVPEARGWTWEESHFTGTGFPKHFYLRYHLYRHIFPMMALGRYQRARKK